jgi:hypothetical protein
VLLKSDLDAQQTHLGHQTPLYAPGGWKWRENGGKMTGKMAGKMAGKWRENGGKMAGKWREKMAGKFFRLWLGGKVMQNRKQGTI